MEEQIVEAVVDGGVFNLENGVKVMAAVGVTVVAVFGYKAVKKALGKKNKVRKDDGKDADKVTETVDVEAEVVVDKVDEKAA